MELFKARLALTCIKYGGILQTAKDYGYTGPDSIQVSILLRQIER